MDKRPEITSISEGGMGAGIGSVVMVVAAILGGAVVALGSTLVWILAVKPRLRRRAEREHFRRKREGGPPRDER